MLVVVKSTRKTIFRPLQCTKSSGGRGFAPNPTGGAHNAPPDPLANCAGALPQTPLGELPALPQTPLPTERFALPLPTPAKIPAGAHGPVIVCHLLVYPEFVQFIFKLISSVSLNYIIGRLFHILITDFCTGYTFTTYLL